eukprot:2788598-Heterocapsa_arctica.AAC.1
MNWGRLQAGTSRDVVLRAFRLGRSSPGARPLGRVAEQSADMAETGWPAQICKSQNVITAQSIMGLREVPVAKSGRPVSLGACYERQAPPELNGGGDSCRARGCAGCLPCEPWPAAGGQPKYAGV